MLKAEIEIIIVSIGIACMAGIPLSVEVSAESAPAELTDPQVAQIMLTIDDCEISTARIADRKAQNKDVKRFAELMLKEHKQDQAEVSQLAVQNNLTPHSADLSEAFADNTKKTNAGLVQLTESKFDSAYVADQISLHQQALETIQKDLIPCTKNPVLREHLQKVVATVSDQLEQAQMLQTKLP